MYLPLRCHGVFISLQLYRYSGMLYQAVWLASSRSPRVYEGLFSEPTRGRNNGCKDKKGTMPTLSEHESMLPLIPSDPTGDQNRTSMRRLVSIFRMSDTCRKGKDLHRRSIFDLQLRTVLPVLCFGMVTPRLLNGYFVSGGSVMFNVVLGITCLRRHIRARIIAHEGVTADNTQQ